MLKKRTWCHNQHPNSAVQRLHPRWFRRLEFFSMPFFFCSGYLVGSLYFNFGGHRGISIGATTSYTFCRGGQQQPTFQGYASSKLATRDQMVFQPVCFSPSVSLLWVQIGFLPRFCSLLEAQNRPKTWLAKIRVPLTCRGKQVSARMAEACRAMEFKSASEGVLHGKEFDAWDSALVGAMDTWPPECDRFFFSFDPRSS